jgi:4a-hydroxytetrahydrobiopterin dehydratase
MKPSLARKKTSRAIARNATLLNLLGTPGLGSLIAGRWLAGTGQLVVFLAGFVLFCLWAFQNIVGYYRMAFGGTPTAADQGAGRVWFGVALCIAAWVWSLVTSLSLMRAVSKVSLESLESFAAGQVKLDEARIILALAALPQWQRNGGIMARTFVFKDFSAAMKFVNPVADLASQAQYEPDIDVRRNRVTLTLTSRDAGGLTEKDFAFARQCDGLAGER